MTQLHDLTTPFSPNFCPGCGDFSIWSAFKNAAVKADWNVNNTVITAGIGCHGHMINFLNVNAFESLHGRGVPVAEGVKMANHKLNVFTFTGDGDSLGEGGNHLIHACRRNHDMVIILHDNAIYGLTTGQTSPASPHGFKTKSTPSGNLDYPFIPSALAIAAGATFVARVLATDLNNLTDTLVKANNHNGLAFIDVLQVCISFNKEYTPAYYKENTYYLDNNYDPANKSKAFEIASQWGPKQIALGVFYEDNTKPSYEAQIPVIKDQTLVSTPPSVRDVSAEFGKLR